MAEIGFAEWTRDSKLRQARYQGLRDDKLAREVVREVPAMSVTIRAGRRRIEITHPDKQLFADGATKLDLANYYEQVAATMLPHLARRPLTLERYPEGIGGPRVMQQHAERLRALGARVRVPARSGAAVEHVRGGRCGDARVPSQPRVRDASPLAQSRATCSSGPTCSCSTSTPRATVRQTYGEPPASSARCCVSSVAARGR